MRNCPIVAALVTLALVPKSAPAFSCTMDHPRELREAVNADVVVAGRIVNYISKGGDATFNVQIDEVLRGQVAQTIFVSWSDPSYSTPYTMPAGLYLIALSRGTPKWELDLKRSMGVSSNSKSKLLRLLQLPCSAPFIFESNSDDATKIRELLKSIENATTSGPQDKPDAPAE